ncbi:metallophosphoesterase [Cyclobacterium sp. SYSU L10401]|uniref:metallophosphoesterase n=1 Tax=Cyclobacterium sp. SYSU L10401 TaxID=2678657 RepID=UPI0013D340BA|nr:metallophosphoesterase [Cyclobacterium sp. SYSU L10401]
MTKVGGTIFIIILMAVLFFLNWYVYQGVKTVLPTHFLLTGKTVYWIVAAGISLWIGFTFFTIMQEGKITTSSQKSLNLFLTISVTQLSVILILFGEDIFRSMSSLFSYFTSSETGSNMPSRRKFVSQLAFTLAAIPFTGFVYGIFKGKYDFRTIRKTVYFKDLPEAFDGFTITQLSDIHAGSFTDYDAVKRGADLAVAQKSDLFVFTGDLVNHKADEIDPMLSSFAQIKAPFGQFSILGNHDYGDYTSWSSPEAKKANFESLKDKHKKLGYDLLLDESRLIEKDGQKIRLLGVENWGVGFHAKGDLEKSLENVDQNEFKILLSHDPSHWDEQVKKHPKNIHLTLSGHTHGMQFGIETPIIRWSPAQYRYPNWAGLAEEAGKFLYVNRGFGFHAFSGRVGIWPEITVIELRRG